MVKGDRKLCPSHPITSLDFHTNLICLFLLHHVYVVMVVGACDHTCIIFIASPHILISGLFPPSSIAIIHVPDHHSLTAVALPLHGPGYALSPLPHAAPILSLTAISHHFRGSLSGLGYLTGHVDLPPRAMGPLCLILNPLKPFAIHQCAYRGTVVENC